MTMTGIEPARFFKSKDFESPASAIPPHGRCEKIVVGTGFEPARPEGLDLQSSEPANCSIQPI